MDREIIRTNYENVLKNIHSVAPNREIKILAATKTQTADDINYLISLGCGYVGENRVNELLSRYEGYDKKAEIHFIGTLQKNKVRYIIDKVSMIHSVDSLSLLNEIDKRAKRINRIMDVLLEVNSGKEENKGGIFPEEVISFYEKAKEYGNVNIRGLMTMAPKCSDKEAYLYYFNKTKEIYDKLFKEDKNSILSMGMSDSYLYAIEAGANMVRIGSAIFGERK